MGIRRRSMFRGAYRVALLAAAAAFLAAAPSLFAQAANKQANQQPAVTTNGIPLTSGLCLLPAAAGGRHFHRRRRPAEQGHGGCPGKAARRGPKDWRRPPRS